MIRPASAADAQALAALASVTPGAPRWTPTHFQTMLTTGASSHALWVATLARMPVGFVALSVLPPQAELESITVHPAHQGRGIGHALLLTALQHARGASITVVHLEVRSSSPAQALYRKLGFTLSGRRPRYYTNPVDDAILMQWTPAAPNPSAAPLSGIISSDYGS